MALLTSKYDQSYISDSPSAPYMASPSLPCILQVDTSKCLKQVTISDNPITDFSFPFGLFILFFPIFLILTLSFLLLCFVLVAGCLWKVDCCTHLWDQLLLSSWYNFSLCLIYSQKSSVPHFQLKWMRMLTFPDFTLITPQHNIQQTHVLVDLFKHSIC